MTMQDPPGTLIRDHLIIPTAILRAATVRLKDYDSETIRPSAEAEYLEQGWTRDTNRKLKRSVVMRRPKPHDRLFEDKVWATMARMGFTSLNKDRNLKIGYGMLPAERKQVDVFAADDEVVLVIECRSTETQSYNQFKDEVEAIQGRRPGLLRTIKKEFPNHKVKFILATRNYQLSELTSERIKSADIIHFDDESIDYYLEMASHLGVAARFQLLGAILADSKVPGLDIVVPAVRASMGTYKYYSFAIQPSVLLKIGYILHRHHAHNDMLPTYQRILQRARLRKVKEFVQTGGVFPNSIIVSIRTKRRDLQFDLKGGARGEVAAGDLHLPRTYQSAYIIDGQHRLYGYAGLPQADTDLIPVIAFVNLPQEEQVRFFMEINENQKAVPKNLRNTLDIELLWNSADLAASARALKLKIAQFLGEHNSSPLKGRVVVGEDARTDLRCITLEAIKGGLDKGNLIGEFKKSSIVRNGTFYRGSNDATYRPLSAFLAETLKLVRDALPDQWSIGGKEGGFVFVNNGIEAILSVVSDVVEHLVATDDKFQPQTMDGRELASHATYYLEPMVEYLKRVSPEEAQAFKSSYGSGRSKKLWRALQVAIRAARPEFSPAGLDDYLKDETRQFNNEAFAMIQALEELLKEDVRNRLEAEYKAEWLKLGVPREVRRDAGQRALDKNIDAEAGAEVEEWDCLYLVDYQKIMRANNEQWRTVFEKRYTRPGEEHARGGWKERTSWLSRLNEIRKKTHHVGRRDAGSAVTENEFAFLSDLTSWLIKGDIDNTLTR
ncbi:DGQHR domain-containing protein [Mycobacteroides chelonae]|nr:hypothetical protein Chelonae_p1628 [Mycobacterium sp. QIA-37]